MSGLLLAIDTADDTLSYALHDGSALRAEHSWRAARQPTTQLAPAVARSLAEVGGPTALIALAVSIGPGSYTGLRSGIALAQGLAEAQDLPLLGISAHEALVASCPLSAGHPFAGRLWVIVPAGRGRFHVRCYQGQAGTWQEGGPLLQISAAELGEQLNEGDALLGADEALASTLTEDTTLHLEPPAAHLRRAGFLAERAWQRLRAAIADGTDLRRAFPPEAIRPIYPNEEKRP